MTLVSDFWSFLSWGGIMWLFFIILANAYFFLILGSSDLKKHNFKSTKLLFFAGLLLLLNLVVSGFFLPTISGMSPTDLERLLGFLYSLIFMNGIIHCTFQFILGIGFVKFGRDNRDPGGIIAQLGGILYLLTWIIFLILRILQKYGGWYNIAYLVSIASFIEIVAWIAYILSILAVVLIMIYTFLTKRPLFIIFAVLLFVAYLMDFLSFLGVI